MANSKSTNTLWVEYLQGLGYTGKSFNDLFQRAMRYNASSSHYSPNDLWKEFLVKKGYEGSVDQMLMDYLGDKGYSYIKSLDGRLRASLAAKDLLSAQ